VGCLSGLAKAATIWPRNLFPNELDFLFGI
jgi:hypothetical protein